MLASKLRCRMFTARRISDFFSDFFIKIAVVRTARFFMRLSAPRQVMVSSLGSLESPLKTACECGAGALWRVRLAEDKRENFAEKSAILLKIWKKYKSSRFLKESDHPKHITGCIGI